MIVDVEGQAIPGIVSTIGEGSIEMRNQEFSRVVVRLDEVVAVAIY